MFPKLFSVGNITIYTYGLFVAIGLIAGLHLSLKIVRYRSLTKDFINHLFIGIVIFGFIGARMAYVLIAYGEFIDDPYRTFMFWEGGLVFWGGLIGGAVWVTWASLRKGFDVGTVGDILAPGIALGHALGRIGCFFAGCCYGKPTNLCTGVTFTNPESLAYPLNVRLHPTQLYSSLFLFILSGVLYMKIKSPDSKPASVFGLYILSYGIFRILIEFFRGDFRGDLIAGFTPTQWIALIGIGAGMFLFIKSSKWQKQRSQQ